MTNEARTPIRIEQRRCSRAEFKAAGAEVTYVAFAKITTPLGYSLNKEEWVGAGTRKEVGLMAKIYQLESEICWLKKENCRLKKGIKNIP